MLKTRKGRVVQRLAYGLLVLCLFILSASFFVLGGVLWAFVVPEVFKVDPDYYDQELAWRFARAALAGIFGAISVCIGAVILFGASLVVESYREDRVKNSGQ